MKRPPIDRSQRVLAIHNLKVTIMSIKYWMRFGLRKCHFRSISGSAGRRCRRAQYTESRPICQVLSSVEQG